MASRKDQLGGVILMGMGAWLGYNVLTGKPLEFAAEPCDEDCGRMVEPTYNSDDAEWEDTTCAVCLEEVADYGADSDAKGYYEPYAFCEWV